MRNNRPLAFHTGSAVEPESLTDCGGPADFDAFRADQKKRPAAVPFKGKVRPKKVRTIDGADIYAVSIPCAGPWNATG